MSTITKEFTKEQLIARIHQVTAINKYRISRDPDADGFAMDNELLAIALASLEAEPVYFVEIEGDQDINAGRIEGKNRPDLGLLPDGVNYLYAAPLAPEVPEEWQQWIADVAEYLEGGLEADGELEAEGSIEAKRLLSRRTAMLQGKAEPRDDVRSEHAEWSQSTFGDVGPIGPLKHLSKEALEAAAEPEDLSEWADMQFLLWDAQRRAGITDEQITQAMIDKLAVNKSRQWPEPKDGAPRLHIKPASQK